MPPVGFWCGVEVEGEEDVEDDEDDKVRMSHETSAEVMEMIQNMVVNTTKEMMR